MIRIIKRGLTVSVDSSSWTRLSAGRRHGRREARVPRARQRIGWLPRARWIFGAAETWPPSFRSGEVEDCTRPTRVLQVKGMIVIRESRRRVRRILRLLPRRPISGVLLRLSGTIRYKTARYASRMLRSGTLQEGVYLREVVGTSLLLLRLVVAVETEAAVELVGRKMGEDNGRILLIAVR